MRPMLLRLCLPLLLFALLPAAGRAATLEEAGKRLQAEYRQAVREQQEQRARIAREKKDLLGRRDQRRLAVAGLEKSIKELEGELEKLRRREEEFAARERHVIQEMNQLAGTVQTSARDLLAMVDTSLVSAFQPQRAAPLRRYLEEKKLPTMAEVRDLVETWFAEIEGGSQIVKQHGEFVGLDGRLTAGDVVRLGALTAFYRRDDNGEIGFAVYGRENEALLAVSRASWLVKRCLREYLSGKGTDAYLDFSGGSTVRQLALQPTAWERLRAGGPLVWPILFLGLVALGLSLERFFFLRRVKSNTDRVMSEVISLVGAGRWQESEELLSNRRGPVYNVLAAGLRFRRAGREVLENVFEEAIMKELPRLERFLPTLQVLAAVAPLLGLLGTVTGMINTFQVITIFGTGDPRMMSGGISEALVTTELGLVMAIPILLLHSYFSRKVESIIGDMEEKAVGLTVALVNRES
ncbi:MAG: DUF3450 family protein [Deltaproteobacteria bacterium]|nr:DUF3450 family protein [Deltaproteobacteria bacterium]